MKSLLKMFGLGKADSVPTTNSIGKDLERIVAPRTEEPKVNPAQEEQKGLAEETAKKENALANIFAKAKTNLETNDNPAEFIKVSYGFSVYCPKAGSPREAYANFENATIPNCYFVPQSVIPSQINGEQGHRAILYIKIGDIKSAGAALEEVVDAINNNDKSVEVPTTRGTYGYKWTFNETLAGKCCSESRVSLNVRASDTKNEIFAYEARRRIEKIKSQFGDGEETMLQNLSYLANYYEKAEKPKIAEALRKHKSNLSGNQSKRDVDAPLYLNFDNAKLVEKVFPQYAEMQAIDVRVSTLVSQREKEIAQIRQKYRKDTVAGSCNQVERIRETSKGISQINKIVLDKDGWNHTYTGTSEPKESHQFALSDSTMEKMLETVVAKYDPKIVELCEKRAELEAPIFAFFDLKQKLGDSVGKVRNLTKEEYRALHRAQRILGKRE